MGFEIEMKYIFLTGIGIFSLLAFLNVAIIRVINQSPVHGNFSMAIEDKVYRFELGQGEVYTKLYFGSLKGTENLSINMNYLLGNGNKFHYESIGYVVPMPFFMGGINDFCIQANGSLILGCQKKKLGKSAIPADQKKRWS